MRNRGTNDGELDPADDAALPAGANEAVACSNSIGA